MGLYTPYNFCFSCLLDYFKLKLESFIVVFFLYSILWVLLDEISLMRTCLMNFKPIRCLVGLKESKKN